LQSPPASQGIPKGGFVSAEETQAKVVKVQVQAIVQVLQAVHLLRSIDSKAMTKRELSENGGGDDA
jgi:hypothetical protein